MDGVFRLTGAVAPYDATVGEFVLVPVGEELLFRGFLLGALLELFRRRQVGSHPAAWAILQVLVAFVFGVVAGHVRVRTESVIGPVLMHATMNVVAVV